ncbi:MAG TPA: hypothetical protein VH877_18515 [Polyangia bacterium]|jgi:hypothetical protein|nr:hypothetical protein [Polyangia bacterium]
MSSSKQSQRRLKSRDDRHDTPGPEEEVITVHIGAEDAEAPQVLSLSPEEVTLLWTGPHLPRRGQAVPLQLESGGHKSGTILGKVQAVMEESGSSRINVRLVSTPLDQARAIQHCLEDLHRSGQLVSPRSQVARREEIVEPDDVLDVLRSLARSGCSGALCSREQTPIEVWGFECEGETDRLYFHPVAPLQGEHGYVLEIQGFNSTFQMPAAGLRSEGGGTASIALPSTLTRIRRRTHRRVLALGLRIRFVHPRWPEVQVERQLRDISHSGLSFYSVPSEDLVYLGLRIDNLELLVPEGPPLRLMAEIRSLQHGSEEDRGLCGMRVTVPSPEDELRWGRIVADLLYPRTTTGSGWTDAVWELYEASGYFRLSGKKPHHFDRLRPPYTEMYQRLDEYPRVGYRVVWPSARGVEGSASALKIYQGTWLGHQLAKRPGQSPDGASAKEVLREIVLGTHEPMLHDPDFHWLLGYCEASVRWMQVAHFDFAQGHETTGQASVLPFRLFEGNIHSLLEAPDAAPMGFTSGEATLQEQRQLLSRIAATRPHAYREALDFVEERFDLAQLGMTWHRAGLAREREVIVARYEGEAVAAAVLESATHGTNLFHLLDGVRLFYLDPTFGPAVRDASFAYLLRVAAAWYRRRGNEFFVYYMEHNDLAHTAGLTDLGEGRIWIIAREIMPDWLEHVFRLTSPQSAKAEATGAAAVPAAVSGQST